MAQTDDARRRSTDAGIQDSLAMQEETQADARVAVLKALAQNDIRIVGFEKGDSADGSQTIAVLVSMEDHPEELQHKVVAPLMLEPSIESIEWDGVSEA